MSYEKELEYLRKEFSKSKAKFHEAEREGWHTDVNIYKDNMENFEYQIHIHEQAEKADKYEAKAVAFDRVREKVYARINHIVRTSHPDQRKPGYIDGLYNALDIISEELESGESE